MLSDNWLLRYTPQENFNQNFAILFKGVLEFDLERRPGAIIDLTTIYRSILTQIYVFLVSFTIFQFDIEKFISKNCKYIFFYQKSVHLGENTSLYCSRIIVVHVHAGVFSKVHPACHNIAKGIKPGSNPKKTNNHAVDCSKAVCWGVKGSM